MKETNLDHLFSNRLLNYEETPPSYVWDEVQASLLHESPKKRYFIYFIRSIAAGIVLFLGFMSGYYFSVTKHESNTKQVTLLPLQQAFEFVALQIHPTLITIDSKPSIHLQSLVNTPLHQKSKVLPHSSISSVQTLTNPHRQNSIQYSQNIQISTIEKVNIAHEKEMDLIGFENRLQNSLETELTVETHQNFTDSAYIRTILQAKIYEVQIVDNKTNTIPIEKLDSLTILANLEAEKDKEDRLKHTSTTWMAGAGLSSVVASRNQQVNLFPANLSDAQSDVNQEITKQMNPEIASGVAFAVRKGKRWTITAGIQYSQINYQTENLLVYQNVVKTRGASTQITTTFANEQMQMIDTFTANRLLSATNVQAEATQLRSGNYTNYSNLEMNHSLKNISIPLGINYIIIDRKLDWIASTFFSTSFTVKETYDIQNQQQKLWQTSITPEIKQWNYRFSVGLGVEYPLLHNLLFSIQPMLNYTPDLGYPVKSGFRSGANTTLFLTF